MYVFAGIFSGMLMFNAFRYTYQWTLRKATGWEDPETKEFEQKQVAKFLENNKDAEVIKLNPNPENYF